MKKDTEYEAQLGAAVKELKSMRDARARQQDMVSALVQQRDMYRSLLADQDKAHGPTSSTLALTSGTSTTINSADGGGPTHGQPSFAPDAATAAELAEVRACVTFHMMPIFSFRYALRC